MDSHYPVCRGKSQEMKGVFYVNEKLKVLYEFHVVFV